MKKIIFAISLVLVLAVATVKAADAPTPKENVFDTKPLGVKVSIKMVGPYSQDIHSNLWLVSTGYGITPITESAREFAQTNLRVLAELAREGYHIVCSEPTAAQSEAATATEHDASDVMKRWDALKTADLSRLNRALHTANLPEVQIESDPHKEEEATDEE